MEIFLATLASFLPVYLTCFVGVWARQISIITEDIEKKMMSLVVQILIPCLVIDRTIGNTLLKDAEVVFWVFGTGVLVVLIGLLVASGVGRLMKYRMGEGMRTFSLTAGVQNYGFIAIPVLMVTFPESDSLGLLFVHGMGAEIAMWTFGLFILSGKMRSLRFLLNGPVVGVFIALVLVWTGADDWLRPEHSMLGASVGKVLAWLGACAIPLALLLIGAMIADLIRKESFSYKALIGGAGCRLFCIPVLVLLLAKFLPIVPELREVLIIQAAMPAAMTPIIMARLFGGKPGVAVQVVVTTSILGFVTIPLWIQAGRIWVLGL